jgi:hypothetical protein
MCNAQQYGNGGTIFWAGWTQASSFGGFGVRPALARSTTNTFLFSTAPSILNDTDQVSSIPNAGGSWAAVSDAGTGTGFISAPGALAASSGPLQTPSVLTIALGADRALWWVVGDSTGWPTGWTQISAHGADAKGYFYSSPAYAFDLGSSRGYTGDGNWAGSDYTGECASTQWGIGVSAAADGTDVPHSLLCATTGFAYNYTSSQHTLHIAGANDGYGNHTMSPPDWDPGFYKGECAVNEVVTGLAQQTNGVLSEVRCSRVAAAPGTTFGGGTNCRARVFSAGNSQEWPGDGTDWAFGYYKGECAQGSAVAGISKFVHGGVHAILCCDVSVL